MSDATSKTILGMQHAKDEKYAIASLLSYWVFSCRDTQHTPAMGTGTWTYLEKSIENSAFSAESLESYVQNLQNKLISTLRPERLSEISGKISIEEIRQDSGENEQEILTLLKNEPSIIQVICRINHELFKEQNKIEEVV